MLNVIGHALEVGVANVIRGVVDFIGSWVGGAGKLIIAGMEC
jgi:hypothetical protein